jgi:hypothetical protein
LLAVGQGVARKGYDQGISVGRLSWSTVAMPYLPYVLCISAEFGGGYVAFPVCTVELPSHTTWSNSWFRTGRSPPLHFGDSSWVRLSAMGREKFNL